MSFGVKMNPSWLLCAVISLALFISIEADELSPLSVTFEHSFDGGKSFKPKGSVLSWANGGKSFILEEPELTTEDQSSLRELASSDSLYVVRAYTEPNSFILVGSCQAKYLLASEGKMALILSIDSSGSPVAVSIVAKNQSLNLEAQTSSGQISLSTVISFQKPALAIGPDTQEYLAKLNRQMEEKRRKEQDDNRSILSKYWMYIVPALLFFMILNSADPNAAAGNAE